MYRIVTGDRPTGALHLGHYFGTLATRVALQRQGHEVFVVVADYQVITDRDRATNPRATVLDLVLDYLGAGLDPERTVVFAHSAVPALHQLMLPFLSLVSTGELRRNPTVKDEIAHSQQASVSGLMLTYPVHQAADVLACRGERVPVGRDQVPHLELMRTIVRRFTSRYGPLFVIPEPVVSATALLPGLDGAKMGKSRGNAIALRAMPEEINAMLRAARTDSGREITFEPQRRPEVAGLLQIAAACLDADPVELAASIGGGGGAGLKRVVRDAVEHRLIPMRRRRAEFSHADAARLLAVGAAVANEVATDTLRRVRTMMGMDYGARSSSAHS